MFLSPWITLSSGSGQLKVARPGPRGALLCISSLNSLFICLSQKPQNRARGRLLKYCYSMVSFLCVKRQLSLSVLLSDLHWLTLSMPWSPIMESTVVCLYLVRKGKRSYFHFFFPVPSELKLGTMPALCLRKSSQKVTDGAETNRKLVETHLSEIFCSADRFSESCLLSDTMGNNDNTWKTLITVRLSVDYQHWLIFLNAFIFYFDHCSATWLEISPERKLLLIWSISQSTQLLTHYHT